MLRISSGTAKNKKLLTPSIEGYRGVQEISKMAVFSIIGPRIEGSNVIDLYAGSGNMGIEALSRGASFCTFVDENPEAIAIIEKNLFFCGFLDNYQLIRKDSLKYVVDETEVKGDIIFADPFYSNQTHKHFFKNVANICNRNTQLFFFHAPEYDISHDVPQDQWNIVTTRKFGKSAFTLLTVK